MVRVTGGGDDVEWLDGDGTTTPHDDEVLAAGSHRPPLRRRTRLALGALVATALAGGVILAVTADGVDGQRAATTTRTVAPIRSSERAVAIVLPQRAPRPALRAIRAAFPTADLTGFSAAIGADSRPGPYLAYNLRAGRRLITITVGPPRLGDTDAVRRTATSLELAQLLGEQRVDIRLRTARGAPTAKDFAAMQRLVQDTRLLAVS